MVPQCLVPGGSRGVPTLLTAHYRTVRRMELANGLCRFREMAVVSGEESGE